MTNTASVSGSLEPDVTARPARSEPRKRRYRRGQLFGLAMLAPTLIFVSVFFFAPIILTAVTAFTNMTSATGITGGAYLITPTVVRELQQQGFAPALVQALEQQVIHVDDATLAAAREAGVAENFLADIAANLSGRQFASERDFERELKQFQSRPRRIRDLKLAIEPFTESILNQRFGNRADATAAVYSVAPDVTPAELDTVLKNSYTGWVWTTENFAKLSADKESLRVFLNTVFYVSTTLAFNVLVALFMALALFYLPPTTGSVFSALWLLPRITPVVLYAVMWKWFTWDNGFIANLAGYLGLPSFNYMKGSVPTAWTIVILVNGFVGASLGMILFSGALRAIPRQQLWASEVDGASRLQQVRCIILPQLRWPIMFVTCYQALSLVGSYEQIWLTTNGGPGRTTTVWSLEAFRTALLNYSGNLQYGMGAAMALVLVAGGLVVSIFFLRLFRFNDLVEKPRIEL
ncbi:carbohydrate ABC transporter permease [Saccharospirillum mangrovi]|uniref:carbohydrate ABC transporter permease n=1 Tax=Saccharospirillum mangrovi TaxID=2161747 RepID=UPI0018E4EA86|nr:sugar ABC transporter permease [Saccharospirillum mangrovi]